MTEGKINNNKEIQQIHNYHYWMLEGEILVGDQHLMSHKCTWRIKRKSQVPELLKGYPVDFPSSDELGSAPDTTAVPGKRVVLQDSTFQGWEGCHPLMSTGPSSSPYLPHFLCYCSEKQGLPMHQRSASLSGDASANAISGTASLQTSILPDMSGWQMLLP